MEPRISCSELFMRLGEDEVLVVDCRYADASRWSGVQIPGALRMTPEEISTSGQILPDDELIVLYGTARDLSDAKQSWRILLQYGRYAVCLDGGLDAWVHAGYPVERRVQRPRLRTGFQPSQAGQTGAESSSSWQGSS